jgi:uncharacterized glyoxalase superfamily protein PhnB
MQELAQFYQDGLQLNPPQGHADNHLGFQLEGVYFGLDKVDDADFEYPGAVSLWFRVDNIEETFHRFKQLGAKIKYPPTKKPWGDVLAALFDLDGNIVGLAQRQPKEVG